ncbi:MAG TPA: acyltransferase [Burkholderiaceae bacterium]|jgi:peptidoglycan/LPS O-acetylase OafA/YrhL
MTTLSNDKVRPLVLVQVLRACAALLVLAGHTQGAVIAAAKLRGEVLMPLVFPGGFGVDLFFCISGFIMVVSSRRLFETTGARSTFLARRAVRLVPLYWIATLCMLPLLLYGRHPYAGDLRAALATSLSFWPYPTYGFEGEAVFPLHNLGWSLNYEVFFYLVFSVFIVLPIRRAVTGVCLAIMSIVLLGMAWRPESTALRFWTQPIIVEFALGVLAGGAWLRGFALKGVTAGLLAAISVVVLSLNPLGLAVAPGTTTTPNDWVRVASWGLPAAAILFAAVGYEQGRQLRSRALSLLERIGDSSYSLYLMHPFALIVIGKSWMVFGLDRFLPWPVFAATLVVASVSVGLLSFRWLEAPITRWFQHAFVPRLRVAP